MLTLHHHVSSLLQLFFILYATPFISAQSPPVETLPPAPGFNPSLAVLMVIIVGAFFLMGFFSVYIRGCVDRRFTRGHFNTSASPIAAGGRWSRRRRPGLEPEVIDTFPTFLYSAVRGHKIGKDSLECAVCLNEFEDDETLRLIPKCNHVFHPLCIDEWLAYHTTCPVCRANLVPKPDDLAFDLVHFFETSVRLNQTEPPNNVNDHVQEDVLLQVTDDDDRNTEMRNQQSPDILSNTASRNRPPRSWSTGWRFGRLFPRSKSTGHTLVQPGENVDRFTLRLPDEIRSQLMNTHLNRTKSCAVFPRASSSKKGFRSRSGGWLGGNSLHYERFDQSSLTSTPPLISKIGSVRSSKGLSGSNEVSAAPPKSLFKSAKSSFDQLILGVDDNNVNGKNDVGERSSDRLRIDDSHSQV